MSVFAFLRRMLSWFAPFPWQVTLIFIGLVTEMMWTAAVPKGLQRLIDSAISPHDPAVLGRVIALLAAGAVAVSAIGLLREYLYARLTNTIVNRLRLDLFAHLQELSLSFHSTHSAGDIASRFSTDIDSVKQALQSWLAWGVLPSLDIIVATVILFSIDWRLALVAQLIWPLALTGPRYIAPRATAASYDYKREEGHVLEEVHEALAGRTVIKAFGLEATMQARFADRLGAIGRVGMRVAFLSALLDRTSAIGIIALQVTVLGLGATFAYRGSITVGALVAFQSLFITMSNALFYLAQYVPTLSFSAAGLRRLNDILDQKPSVAESATPRPLPPLSDAITFDNVSFSHTTGARTLAGISLAIRSGESVAFVGPSGSGKSTLLNLLLRFYDPDRGAVLYDGVDLRDAARADLVRQTAVVFQDSFLFNISLRENIRLGRLGAKDDEVEAVAMAAEIHEYIMTLPQGYDTSAGERGVTLSGGQRQRIAIARALLRNPSILVLDEATSALDPATEAAIGATINRIGRGRTVVSVTHRLSSVLDADRVFVLANGRLAGGGTHHELIAGNPTYAGLWRRQSGVVLSPVGRAAVTVEWLRALSIFTGLDDAFLERLARDTFVSEFIRDRRTVVVEGDIGDKFYIIVRGTMAVTTKTRSGNERRIAVLQDGDYFGEVALLQDVQRTASVSTLTDTTLLSLQRDAFEALLAQAPGVREKIEARYATRMQKAAAAAEDPTRQTLPR